MNVDKNNLMTYQNNIFSENGEDGIIEKIFSEIKPRSNLCCEFGAWDGIWASNCRNLIVKHNWNAIMIEGDPVKFKELLKTYGDTAVVRCVNNFVDNMEFSLSKILTEDEKNTIDFLSIDIDGLDYEIFESLDFYPQVICIEVNTGHSPDDTLKIPREIAKNNIGQPLQYFMNIANRKGYELVCFTGNAFYIKKELLANSNFKPISVITAYKQHLETIPFHVKKHLFFVNKGIVNPFYKFNNLYLTKQNLELNILHITSYLLTIYSSKLKNKIINL
ncbi:FkbM family methyltransferase, partial [bacterium]|nr:FkbM family methyltransferase [bacterium]